MDEGEMFDINRFEEPAINNLIHTKRKGGLGHPPGKVNHGQRYLRSPKWS